MQDLRASSTDFFIYPTDPRLANLRLGIVADYLIGEYSTLLFFDVENLYALSWWSMNKEQ